MKQLTQIKNKMSLALEIKTSAFSWKTSTNNSTSYFVTKPSKAITIFNEQFELIPCVF